MCSIEQRRSTVPHITPAAALMICFIALVLLGSARAMFRR